MLSTQGGHKKTAVKKGDKYTEHTSSDSKKEKQESKTPGTSRGEASRQLSRGSPPRSGTCSTCSEVHTLTGFEHCPAVVLAKELKKKVKKAEEEKPSKPSEVKLSALSYSKDDRGEGEGEDEYPF